MTEKKIALVTGGNRGIGRETVKQLADLGIRVYLGSRNVKKGDQAAQDLKGNGRDIQCIELDVADDISRKRAIDTIIKSESRLDILINNAGVLLDSSGSSLMTSLDTLRKTMETNVYGPFHLSQYCIPGMRRNNYGRIVNVSSGMGQLSDMGSGYAAYRISKTALNAVTKNLAAEVTGSNIAVNTMSPGWVRTDMGGDMANRSVEQGADTVVWLATLPEDGPSGGFFKDREQIPW